MLLLSLKTLRASQKRLIGISESNKVVPCPLPFLAYTLINLLEDWLLSLMSTLVMGFGPQD
jgi:hypothetical protein